MPGILISGNGVAGPVLAYWLAREGFEVTVVERAAGVRSSGAPVDVRGPAVPVVEAMGVMAGLRAAATRVTHLVLLGRDGHRIARVAIGSLGGAGLEVPRGDLSAVLYGAARDDAEFLFGDSIASLDQDARGVDVTFERAAPRRFDLVVGADGLHSNVRRLAFGPESRFVTGLGMHLAATRYPDELDPAEAILYNTPGRAVALHPAAGRAIAAFFFHGGPVAAGPQAGRRALTRAYEGEGWRVPELVARACESDDLYLDAVSRVRLDTWSNGRVVLLGDAATSVSIFGDGSSTAIAGARRLATALAAHRDDHAAAYRSYEEAHRPVVATKHRKAWAARALIAPGSAVGLAARNLALRAVGLFDRHR